MSKSLKSKLMLFFATVLLAIVCALSVFAVRAESTSVTIEQARESTALNLVTAEQVVAGSNLREGYPHGITYVNGTFTATQSGQGVARSANLLSNRYLDSATAIKGGNEVETSQVTTYITAKFNYSEAMQNMTAGILFGKRTVEGGTRYYAAAISPTQKVVFVYTFDVDANGACKKEAQGPLSYEAKDYAANTDYTIEILIKPEVGIDVYVGGNAIVTDCASVNETNESLTGLTPVIGLSWFDISVTVSDFSMQYLDATVEVEEETPALTIEDARASQNTNLVTAERAAASGNLRESDEHGITYLNGIFTGTQSGQGVARSAKLLKNIWLNSETAIKDGNEVETSQVTTYITAKFNYSEAMQNMTAGILFGKRTVEGGTRYYAAAISPTQKVVFVYTFDVDANGACKKEAQGPLSYEAKDYAANTDYTIEILIKPEVGIDVYVGGNAIVTDCASVNETNESLIGLTPVIGLSWFDISATVFDFSMQYLDAEAKPDAFTIEDARDSEAANLVKKGELSASNNFREKDNYGISFEDGKFVAAATGQWSRAVMKLKNRYLNSDTVLMNGEEISSDHATAYISVDLTFQAADTERNFGTLIGMRENENSITYYAAVVSFSQKHVFIYTFETDMSGKYKGTEAQGPASYTPVSVDLDTKYKLEILISPSLGVSIYWNGAAVCENLKTVYESGKSLLSLTPVIGLAWADVTGAAENFVLKYLNAEIIPEKEEEKPDPGEEPTYPEPGPEPDKNTEIIVPDVQHPKNPNGCGSVAGAEWFVALPLLALSIFMFKRRKSK